MTDFDIYDHPVFHPRKLILETEPIKRLREQCCQWLWTGATGALIQGESRCGKSTAVQQLATQLRNRADKQIPSFRVSIPRRDTPTIRSLCRTLCLQANLRVTRSAVADELAASFMHFLIDKAKTHDTDRVVLFVDEMQRLVPRQFDVFAELFDSMREPPYDSDLTVFFVANDSESESLLTAIGTESHTHVRGRFFTQGAKFSGLTSERGVRHCLKQYDRLRYPIKDGPTYTECFLPEDYRRGWRLAEHSGLLWSVFSDFKRELKLRSWGMQYFTACANMLLTDFLPNEGVDQLSDDMVSSAIEASGLVPSLVTVGK